MSRTFNGSSDFIDCGTHTEFNFPDATFSVSIMFKNSSATNQIFIANNGAFGGWYFMFTATGILEFGLKNSGTDVAYFDSTNTFADGLWHNCVWVVTTDTTVNANNVFTCYVDGGLEAGTTTYVFLPYAVPVSSLINIGNRGAGSPLFYTTGDLAEAAVWDVGLDAAEANALGKGYSPLFIRPTAQLAYWQLIGRASPEIERINGFAGTLTGTSAVPHPRIIMPRGQKVQSWTIATAPSFIPAWAMGSNIPVLGTGNF